MLIPDFYKIIEFKTSQNQVNAVIELNPAHEVYNGHFIGQPVVPGVIQLQIVKELVEKVVQQELFLGELMYAKFLQSIIPEANPTLGLVVKYLQPQVDIFPFTATMQTEDVVFTKVKGIFTRSGKNTKGD